MSLQYQKDRLFGRDIYFDVTKETGGDTVTAPNGDWLLTRGRECLRQSLIRRIITSPGEWMTLPDYGVGARQFVKARNNRANQAELQNRIRSQLLQDERVEKVLDVRTDFSVADTVKIRVVVQPRGDSLNATPLNVYVEV